MGMRIENCTIFVTCIGSWRFHLHTISCIFLIFGITRTTEFLVWFAHMPKIMKNKYILIEVTQNPSNSQRSILSGWKVCQGNKKSSKPTESERATHRDKWILCFFFLSSKQTTFPLYANVFPVVFGWDLYNIAFHRARTHTYQCAQRTNSGVCSGKNKNMKTEP